MLLYRATFKTPVCCCCSLCLVHFVKTLPLPCNIQTGSFSSAMIVEGSARNGLEERHFLFQNFDSLPPLMTVIFILYIKQAHIDQLELRSFQTFKSAQKSQRICSQEFNWGDKKHLVSVGMTWWTLWRQDLAACLWTIILIELMTSMSLHKWTGKYLTFGLANSTPFKIMQALFRFGHTSRKDSFTFDQDFSLHYRLIHSLHYILTKCMVLLTRWTLNTFK